MKDLQKFKSPLPIPSSSSSSSLSNPHLLSIGAETWKIAEDRIQEILSVIQPTVVSDCRRTEIIDYIQALIECSFGIQVLPFGSVPLKTYLPDGDIDLTALSHHDDEQDLMTKLCSLLEYEAENNIEMQVSDVQSIPAQVKVVKCTVGSVSVDISFNQMAGLCALSFLEQVDRYIGKDHLFKKSVILIKAWCFYESRILGAHHGLIATYALETMVLHIINLYHSSLHCPLAVLYKFLVYYNAFDWKRYCLSINGLVLISSLPEVVVKPVDDCDESLLTDEFLRSCREAFSASTAVLQPEKHVFPVKYLNILDPLIENNNLGRSIHKGSFNRIKCALAFGTKQLHHILMLPHKKISLGLEKIFQTTLRRNGLGTRPDVLVPVPAYGAARSKFSGTNVGDGDILSGVQHGLWFNDNSTASVQPNPSLLYENPENTCNAIGQNVQHDQVLNSQANNSLLPPVSSPDTLQTTNAAAVREIPESRGTGSDIPPPELVLQRDRESGQIPLDWESKVSKPLVDANASSVISTVGMPSNIESDESSSRPRFSLEEFPFLGGKPVKMKIPAKVWQPKGSPSSTENIEFGTSKPSFLEGVPPSLAGKQADPDPSCVNNPPAATEGSQVLPKTEEEVVAPSPRLGDENEFPPLCHTGVLGKWAARRG